LLHAGANLRFDMQFELIMTGNERFGAEHHSLVKGMMQCCDDEFILQKNIVKINGEFKMPTVVQLLPTGRRVQRLG